MKISHNKSEQIFDMTKLYEEIKNYYNFLLMKSEKQKTFKQIYPLEKRQQIFEQAKKKSPNSVVVIVEKDPKCTALPDLKHSRFSIAEEQKMMQVCNAIRTRIVSLDQKYRNQPFFLFTNKVLPNKEYSIKQIYAGQKDKQDGLLYFKYSNVDPF